MIDLDELERLHATTGVVGDLSRIPLESIGSPHQWIPRDEEIFLISLRNAFPALARELRMRRRQVQLACGALGDIAEDGRSAQGARALAALREITVIEEEWAAISPFRP